VHKSTNLSPVDVSQQLELLWLSGKDIFIVERKCEYSHMYLYIIQLNGNLNLWSFFLEPRVVLENYGGGCGFLGGFFAFFCCCCCCFEWLRSNRDGL